MNGYDDPDRPLKYRYKCVNDSLVDRYVLRHWWPIAIRAIPAHMPANVVSVLGQLGSYVAFLILSGVLFGPANIAARERPWIFGLVALGLFFYQTLDALDGLQARRTGVDGPLGEFVDHWFDSFNVFLIPLGMALAFPVIPPGIVAVFTLVLAASDWLMLRSVRNTDSLVFEALSTEEGQVLAQLFYLSVWILGYDFWASPGLLPFPLIWVIFGVLVAGISIAALRCIKIAGGLPLLAIELATLVPFAAWTLLAIPKHGSLGLLIGALIVGFNGSRYSGELLRERLLGARYRPLRIDLVVAGPALLASILVPGLPAWASMAAAVAVLAWTLVALAIQLMGAIGRVRIVLGRGFLGKPVVGSNLTARRLHG